MSRPNLTIDELSQIRLGLQDRKAKLHATREKLKAIRPIVAQDVNHANQLEEQIKDIDSAYIKTSGRYVVGGI